jgi:hypothetical protein
MEAFNENILSGLMFFVGAVGFILGHYALSAILLLTAAISVIYSLSV